MIGHLVEIRPWFAEVSEKSELKRLGDLMTINVERHPPLHVQYLYPRNSHPRHIPLNSMVVIQDVEATPLESDPGYCFDSESSRVLNIRPLR